MRRRKRARAVEAIKDAAIVLLALSAIYLALRSQVTANLPGGTVTGWVTSLFRPDAGLGTQEQAGQTLDLKPLRMAVNVRGEGRYGVQYDQTAVDALYAETVGLLRDCLDSAGMPTQVSESVWRTALSERTGVYFDFQGRVPLEVLRASLSLEEGGEALAGARVRRLLLAEETDGAVVLYYSNESEGSYYACSTAEALRGHLQSTLAGRGTNGAVFAFEREYENLAPYVLVTGPGRAGVYAASDPVTAMAEGRETLLEALGFHPQASSSYRSGGVLVVSAWPDRLSISDSGRVTYETTAGEAPKYPVGGGETGAAEAVRVTQQLVRKAAGPWLGEAQLYLMEAERLEGGGWQVDYGYCLGGVSVELGDAGYAARFQVREGQVTGFTLTLRTYTDAGTQTIVLPETQAAAAMGALDAEGRELQLAYADGGAAEQVAAAWIAK